MGAQLSCYNETLSAVNETDFVIHNSTGRLDSDENADLDFILGVGATLISSVSVALGTILQKLAHNRNIKKLPEERSRQCAGLLLNPLWILGLSMMIIIQLPLAMVAYTLTAQSLVVPLAAGSTIVFDQMLAPCLLKEKLTSREVVATLLVIVGIALVTNANAGNVQSYTACELLDSWTNGGFLGALGVLIFLIVASVLLVHCPPDKFMREAVDLLRPVSFCIIAGGAGAIMDILLKATGEFTQSDVAGSNAWSTIHPYYHIALVPFLAFTMISYINQGLQAYDAIIFLPLYNCIYIILATCYGAVFFEEFDHFDTSHFVSFFGGVAITLSGITIMSLFSLKKKRLEEASEDASTHSTAPGFHTSPSVDSDSDTDGDSDNISTVPSLRTAGVGSSSGRDVVVQVRPGGFGGESSSDDGAPTSDQGRSAKHRKSRSEPFKSRRAETAESAASAATAGAARRRHRPRFVRPKLASIFTPAFGSLSARDLMTDLEDIE